MKSKMVELEELRMVSGVVSKELAEAKNRGASASSRAEAMSHALKNLEVSNRK